MHCIRQYMSFKFTGDSEVSKFQGALDHFHRTQRVVHALPISSNIGTKLTADAERSEFQGVLDHFHRAQRVM
jgi:hypothetical protein